MIATFTLLALLMSWQPFDPAVLSDAPKKRLAPKTCRVVEVCWVNETANPLQPVVCGHKIICN